MGDYKGLKAWERAHRLTLSVYEVSSSFPKEELYGLTAQLRRASSSIPANIAEGCGRNGDAELARFLTIAMGSASEVEYHLLLARDLGFLRSEDFDSLNTDVAQVKRMLASLVATLKHKSRSTKD